MNYVLISFKFVFNMVQILFSIIPLNFIFNFVRILFPNSFEFCVQFHLNFVFNFVR
jgi:hypothetical protein